MNALRGTLAALVVGIAAALLVVALAILLFLNPVWVGFEQGRAQAAAWTGFSDGDLHAVTNSVLHDLVLGPPDFAVELNGSPVLNDRERQHMRDVRGVFAGFYVVAIGGTLMLAGAFALARGREARARLWRRLARSGTAIVVVTIVAGGLGVLFFDAAFEAFHELFFPPGSFLFDPRTDRLVQLFPDQFWSETTVAVGVAIVGLGLALRVVGRRRALALAGALTS
jgi:integral membrane protein (TIGR01906 family)